jgi:hypothetical protein
VEYGAKEEATTAVETAHGSSLLDQTLGVDYAFAEGPLRRTGAKK